MKKIINVKEIMMIIISLILIVISTDVFATGLVIGDGNNNSQISASEYDNAQTPEVENTNNSTNNSVNNSTNNNSNNTNNNTKVYNTNNKSDLPQTGIEDYNIGILLIICVSSAIFAYKKVNDYKNI